MAKKTPSNGTIKAQAISIGAENEFLELMPKISLFPGEDQATYDDFHEQFLSDLSPMTPYETVIVENLVTLEWEAIRHRRIRDDLIRIKYQKYAAGAFMTNKVELPRKQPHASKP